MLGKIKMKKIKPKYFKFVFWTILILALLLRIIPCLNNNFYFTMDQGYTAMNVREILTRGIVPLKGPATSLSGVYAGPIWYWLEAIGYAIFSDSPFGGNFILIILNVIILGVLIKTIANKISPNIALLTGVFLLFFWSFFEISRYAFNPFPMVFLTILSLIYLTRFLEVNEKYFIFAAIPVGLSFHAEVASFVPFFIWFAILGIIFLAKKKLKLKTFLVSFLVIALFFIPTFISEFSNSFSQTKSLLNHLQDPAGTFAGTQFKYISEKFFEIISEATIPQNSKLGAASFLLITFLFILGKFNKISINKNGFSDYFIYLSLFLTAVSWIFFGTNKGWHTWQTIYIPPILFLSVIFILVRLKTKLKIFILTGLFIFQFLFFLQRYAENLKPSSDQSILANEIRAIDWVYQKSGEKGFYVYTYLPSVYDTPYQYLFWWYGRKTYGYMPCEYSSYPNSPKMFVPGAKHYENPKRECTNLRFLIIEPDINTQVREKWLSELRQNTELLEETSVGNIKIEKREILTN
jgi:4-amino-4-deoxy-L-arabinose transferase-like glycosyltransferase